MKIVNVRIERYRSLYDVDVNLLPLMALVGANGAGKSNFVDALNFMAVALSSVLSAAVNGKGGPDRLAFRWKSKSRQPIAVSATVRFTLSEVQSPRPGFSAYLARSSELGKPLPEFEMVYGFGISPRGRNGSTDFEVISERVEIRALQGTESVSILSIVRDRKGVRSPRVSKTAAIDLELRTELVWPFEDTAFAEVLRGANQRDQLLIGALIPFNPVIASVSRALREVQVFSIIPAISKLPGAPPPISQLDTTGLNLPSAVRALQEHAPDAWSKVLEWMQELEPRFSEITTRMTPERRLILQFDELGATVPWTAAEISDGTIRMLALLTALYDPRSQIIIIEEPEDSIHAWMVRSFVKACRDVVEDGRKQVILTSHSPALIDFFTPEELYVVWRNDEGRSNIAPILALDPDIQSIWEHGDATLFDVVDSALVREAVPGVS